MRIAVFITCSYDQEFLVQCNTSSGALADAVAVIEVMTLFNKIKG